MNRPGLWVDQRSRYADTIYWDTEHEVLVFGKID
jgi:hypothetical protein